MRLAPLVCLLLLPASARADDPPAPPDPPAPSLSQLEELARQPASASQAIQGLSKLLMDADDSSTRRRILVALTQIGPRAEGAVPLVVPLCKDGDMAVRRAALRALLALAPDQPAAVPLEECVGETATVKMPATEPIFARVLALHRASKTPAVRETTLELLAAVGPRAVPLLRGALADPQEGVRKVARRELVRLGQFDAAVLRPYLRDTAAELIRGHRPLPDGAFPDVVAALRDGDKDTVRGALAWLLSYSGDRQAALEPLLGLLGEGGSALPLVLETLAELGPAARPAQPMLLKLIAETQRDPIAEAALQALKRTNPIPREALPAVIHQFARASHGTRQRIVHLVQEWGEPAPGVLGEMLTRGNPQVRSESALVLALAFPKHAKAERAGIRLLLDNEDSRVRQRAALALEVIGEEVDTALLVQALNDGAEPVCRLAAQALRRRKPSADLIPAAAVWLGDCLRSAADTDAASEYGLTLTTLKRPGVVVLLECLDGLDSRNLRMMVYANLENLPPEAISLLADRYLMTEGRDRRMLRSLLRSVQRQYPDAAILEEVLGEYYP